MCELPSPQARSSFEQVGSCAAMDCLRFEMLGKDGSELDGHGETAAKNGFQS